MNQTRSKLAKFIALGESVKTCYSLIQKCSGRYTQVYAIYPSLNNRFTVYPPKNGQKCVSVKEIRKRNYNSIPTYQSTITPLIQVINQNNVQSNLELTKKAQVGCRRRITLAHQGAQTSCIYTDRRRFLGIKPGRGVDACFSFPFFMGARLSF